MKKAIFLLLVVASLQSCKKCGTCYYTRTITTSTPESGYPKVTEYSEDGCEEEYKEMKKSDEDETVSIFTPTGTPATMVIHRKYCN